ncbi:hypothetical protein D3C85_1022320 [compost metagenome]
MLLITSMTRPISWLSWASRWMTDTDFSISPPSSWIPDTWESTSDWPFTVSWLTFCALSTASAAFPATAREVADISVIAVASSSIWSRWLEMAW